VYSIVIVSKPTLAGESERPRPLAYAQEVDNIAI
jgi:hypothetical protein